MKKSVKSYHSVCRWSFHAGKGGFQPANIRPLWAADRFNTTSMVQLVQREIRPRVPEHIELGIELHYDTEIDDRNAAEIAAAMVECKLPLAMITPGAHSHFGYGGVSSLDPRERSAAEILGSKTIELTYGALRKTWHADPALVPTVVIWNGSFGYDLATIGVREMYQNLKKSIAALCRHEAELGGKLYFGLEPKPNEGHPAMLLPTVASALLFWRKLESEFGLDRSRLGLNIEFGHSEMIGLDPLHDIVEELDDNAMTHVHLNSQGYNDGIIHGGPGKYDIDHGTRVNGINISIARLMQDAGYNRWKGHDMQPRPYDDERQAVDRVVRSILSWEACEQAARDFDSGALLKSLAARETARAEDMMRSAVVDAQQRFDEMYRDD